MKLFPFRKKEYFTYEENSRVVEAIREAETKTSGEVRVYIESRCKYVDALDRAGEIFWTLKMDHTKARNAVLVYVAMKDHQFAIFADRGIHEKLGNVFWQQEVREMSAHFHNHHYIDALLYVIRDVGAALAQHFPYTGAGDRNELPDDIMFGH